MWSIWLELRLSTFPLCLITSVSWTPWKQIIRSKEIWFGCFPSFRAADWTRQVNSAPWDLAHLNPLNPCSLQTAHDTILIQPRSNKTLVLSPDPSTSQIRWRRSSGQRQLLSARCVVTGTSSSTGVKRIHAALLLSALTVKLMHDLYSTVKKNTVLFSEEPEGCVNCLKETYSARIQISVWVHKTLWEIQG